MVFRVNLVKDKTEIGIVDSLPSRQTLLRPHVNSSRATIHRSRPHVDVPKLRLLLGPSLGIYLGVDKTDKQAFVVGYLYS